jgi:hypothetical protein
VPDVRRALASAAAVHTRTVAAATYHDDQVLRIRRQYAPPGIMIAGEIDYQAEGALGRALAEAIRLGGDLDVDVSGLSFIDVRCALLIAAAARVVAGFRAVRLRCRPEVAARSIRPRVAGIPRVQVLAR